MLLLTHAVRWVFWAETPALSWLSPCGGHVPVANATIPSVTLQPPHCHQLAGGRWEMQQERGLAAVGAGMMPHPELQAVVSLPGQGFTMRTQ